MQLDTVGYSGIYSGSAAKNALALCALRGEKKKKKKRKEKDIKVKMKNV